MKKLGFPYRKKSVNSLADLPCVLSSNSGVEERMLYVVSLAGNYVFKVLNTL